MLVFWASVSAYVSVLFSHFQGAVDRLGEVGEAAGWDQPGWEEGHKEQGAPL